MSEDKGFDDGERAGQVDYMETGAFDNPYYVHSLQYRLFFAVPTSLVHFRFQSFGSRYSGITGISAFFILPPVLLVGRLHNRQPLPL